MPFNPSDPRGSIASLLAGQGDLSGSRTGTGTFTPPGPFNAGPSPGAVAANPFNDPTRVSAINSMGGDLPMPTSSMAPMASRSGVPGAPGQPPPAVGITAGPSGPNPLLGARGAELAAFAAGGPGNPLYAGTGGNSPGVTVTPGITPSNYVDYFGKPPTSAADAPMAGMYPQYTSVADPSGNTSWQGNMAAGGMPFNPAQAPSITPDFGMPVPGGPPKPGLV